MSVELFSSQEVGEYTAKIYRAMLEEIESFSDEKIMNCDFIEWANYYANKYEIVPITLYMDNIEKQLENALK